MSRPTSVRAVLSIVLLVLPLFYLALLPAPPVRAYPIGAKEHPFAFRTGDDASSLRADTSSRPVAIPSDREASEAGASKLRTPIILEPGFSLTTYATGLTYPTSMAFDADGRLWVTQRTGEVVILTDSDQDQQADTSTIFSSGIFTEPLGVAFRGNDVYISNRGKVTVVQDTDGDDVGDVYTDIIAGLPSGQEISWHGNNNLVFGPDDKLYFGLGSTCNQCAEPDPRSGTVMRYNPDGTGEEIYAAGLRNTYDLAFHPVDGTLWGADNGFNTGDPNNPPDELNRIIQGHHYGWPDCWGTGQGTNCEGTDAPVVELDAHASTDGLAFYTGTQFPEEYRNDLFIAEYGSFDFEAGHKVVRVELIARGGVYRGTASDFIRNMTSPLDVVISPEGALLIADFDEGVIYRVVYTGSITQIIDDADLSMRFDMIVGRADRSASGNTYRASSTGGKRFKFITHQATTAGTLILYQGPDQGMAKVFIDGVSHGVLDLYAPEPDYQHSYLFSHLPYRQHIVELLVLGTRNPASSGTEVRLDALKFRARVEDSNYAIQYNSWQGFTHFRAYEGGYRLSKEPGASASFTFTGTQFSWITIKGPYYGMAEVIVDGVKVRTVDLYNPTIQWQHEIVIDGLSDQEHTVQIVVLRSGNLATHGRSVVVDAIVVPSGVSAN